FSPIWHYSGSANLALHVPDARDSKLLRRLGRGTSTVRSRFALSMTKEPCAAPVTRPEERFGDQDPFVYQTSPQQYRDDPSASPQITCAIPVELTAIPQ